MRVEDLPSDSFVDSVNNATDLELLYIIVRIAGAAYHQETTQHKGYLRTRLELELAIAEMGGRLSKQGSSHGELGALIAAILKQIGGSITIKKHIRKNLKSGSSLAVAPLPDGDTQITLEEVDENTDRENKEHLRSSILRDARSVAGSTGGEEAELQTTPEDGDTVSVGDDNGERKEKRREAVEGAQSNGEREEV